MLRVLLVEDSPVVAMVTAAFFRRLGADVLIATTLGEAIEKLERYHFSLAILDLGLPDSDPDETVERFSAVAGPALPYAVLTASATQHIKEAALQFGVITVIERGQHQREGLRAAWEYAREAATRHHTLTASMLERIEGFLAKT